MVQGEILVRVESLGVTLLYRVHWCTSDRERQALLHLTLVCDLHQCLCGWNVGGMHLRK